MSFDKEYFGRRRTIRDYSSRPLDEALLNSILEDAMRAPTTGNMQLYSVIVTRSEEGKKALAPAHFNQPTLESAAVVLTVCADLERFSRWCRLSDANPGFDNLQGLMYAMADAFLYAQQVVTIAEMHGLGTCYLGTVTFNAEDIARILELPKLVIPVATITIGWPASEPEQCERLPLEAVAHDEKYRADTDEKVKELFRSKDDFPANARYIEENGKKTLAQVFTDVRYPRSMNEEFSTRYLDFIRSQGVKL